MRELILWWQQNNVWANYEVNFGRAYMLGRHPHCDIVIPDLSVSRQHVKIFSDKQGFYLRNISQSVDLFANSQRLSSNKKIPLQPETVLWVGKVRVDVNASHKNGSPDFVVECNNGHRLHGYHTTCPHCGLFLAGARTIYSQDG